MGVPKAIGSDVPNLMKDVSNFMKDVPNFVKDVPSVQIEFRDRDRPPITSL